MPDPRQAPDAVSDIFLRIEEYLDGTNLMPHLWLSPVVEVTEGLFASANGLGETRYVGDLALTAADLIEAHLGPVRRSARLVFNPCTCCDVATRTLLLATDAWATVLYLGVSD